MNKELGSDTWPKPGESLMDYARRVNAKLSAPPATIKPTFDDEGRLTGIAPVNIVSSVLKELSNKGRPFGDEEMIALAYQRGFTAAKGAAPAEVTAEQFRLCYVEGCTAFFTTQPVTEQWGDDWNDAPYEHNAGTPYEWQEYRQQPQYKLKQIEFDGPFIQPCDGHTNSPWCVQDINRGIVAWLWSEDKRVVIPAGTTFEDFVQLVGIAGGRVAAAKGGK